jgi:hypothetical protein
MSLNRGEINPLGILELRRLTFIPEHFATILVSTRNNMQNLESWIEYNLNSRYCIQNTYGLDTNKKLVEMIKIGIEEPKEMTMFTLGCRYLYNQKD